MDNLTSAKNKSEFRAKHQTELMIFEASRKALKEHYGDRKWDSLKILQTESKQSFKVIVVGCPCYVSKSKRV